MRRIISLVVVALVMAAMMLVMVMPAMAQPVPPPPNCESGQFQAATNAFDRDDFGQLRKHSIKSIDCLVGNSPGEGQ